MDVILTSEKITVNDVRTPSVLNYRDHGGLFSSLKCLTSEIYGFWHRSTASENSAKSR